MALPVRKLQWGQLGPAMRALPSDRWRDFVFYYLTGEPGHGSQANAARKAGFGKPNSTPQVMAQLAYQVMCDERMQAAIAEQSKKIIRACAPEASQALLAMIRDPAHKDHMRAVMALMDRVDPVTTNQNIHVTHRHIDPVAEEIEELRALRQLGTSREKLLELFGGNGLARLEALEAADSAKRAESAKVIDAEAVEVSDG
jgi:hypothetical protein